MIGLAFSGGKDSLLALTHARTLTGKGEARLVFTVPSFPFPSPHYENLACVELLARSLGLRMSIVKLPRGMEKRVLASHLERLGVSLFVAGDVLLDDHLRWHEEVAGLAGAELLEPLYNAETEELFWRTVEAGIEFTIIACRPPCPPRLLGTRVARDNAEHVLEVLKATGTDPIGELGEYHTLVLRAPGMGFSLEARTLGKRSRGPYGDYLLLECRPNAR